MNNITTTSTVTYTYGAAGWKDLLTNYNGTTLAYDANGNPLSYRGMTLTWAKGRRLATLTKDNATTYYSYDRDGLRIQKTVGGVVHTYIYLGEVLVCETWGHSCIEYFYDESGAPLYFLYDDGSSVQKYYYITNAQGDVIQLRSASNTLLALYSYDAWGKLLSVKDASGNAITSATHIANINPIRYRGYYYDTESGFYYLKSRYYDPEVCRFISPDDPGILTVSPLAIHDKNLFAYCDNNPTTRMDDGGEFWHILAGAAIGAVAGAISSIVSQAVSGQSINWKAVGISAASGAISGAVTAACPCMGPVATGVVQGGLSAATYAATEKIAYGRDPSIADTLMVGVTSGVMAGGMKYVAQEMGWVQCFIAGTLVAAKQGQIPIEQIEAGDLVWATDPETGETTLKQVVRTFKNESEELVHLTVNREEIVTTPGHPFYVPVKGWTQAIQLRAGDRLQLLNGEYVTVEQVQHELLESSVFVYNFEVEDFHTYYVGSNSVLVHNQCKQNLPKNGTTLKTDDALDLAIDYLGEGYSEASPGRFVSADGLRQVRMGTNDLLGKHAGGPHINFDMLKPKYYTHHVFFVD